MNTALFLSDASIVRVFRNAHRYLLSLLAFLAVVTAPRLVEGQTDGMGLDHAPRRDVEAARGGADAGPANCHDANAVCVTLAIPTAMADRPEALVVSLQETVHPMCVSRPLPPLRIERPKLPAGRELSVVMEGRATGTYYLQAAIYMPGGGFQSGDPRTGVDYVAVSGPLKLTGEPLIVSDPIAFTISN